MAFPPPPFYTFGGINDWPPPAAPALPLPQPGDPAKSLTYYHTRLEESCLTMEQDNNYYHQGQHHGGSGSNNGYSVNNNGQAPPVYADYRQLAAAALQDPVSMSDLDMDMVIGMGMLDDYSPVPIDPGLGPLIPGYRPVPPPRAHHGSNSQPMMMNPTTFHDHPTYTTNDTTNNYNTAKFTQTAPMAPDMGTNTKPASDYTGNNTYDTQYNTLNSTRRPYGLIHTHPSTPSNLHEAPLDLRERYIYLLAHPIDNLQLSIDNHNTMRRIYLKGLEEIAGMETPLDETQAKRKERLEWCVRQVDGLLKEDAENMVWLLRELGGQGQSLNGWNG